MILFLSVHLLGRWTLKLKPSRILLSHLNRRWNSVWMLWLQVTVQRGLLIVIYCEESFTLLTWLWTIVLLSDCWQVARDSTARDCPIREPSHRLCVYSVDASGLGSILNTCQLGIVFGIGVECFIAIDLIGDFVKCIGIIVDCGPGREVWGREGVGGFDLRLELISMLLVGLVIRTESMLRVHDEWCRKVILRCSTVNEWANQWIN